MTDLKTKLEKIALEQAEAHGNKYQDTGATNAIRRCNSYHQGFSSATDLLLPLLEEAIKALKQINSCKNDKGETVLIGPTAKIKSEEALNSINEKLGELK